MSQLTEWENMERDRLARWVFETLNANEQKRWVDDLYCQVFAQDMAVRIQQQPLERQADDHLANCSRDHLEAWIESMGYESDRKLWRERLNRARLRRKENAKKHRAAA